MNRRLIFTLLHIVLAASSCTKPCHESDHNFSINVRFFPEKDSITVGDTLWVNVIIPKNLVDTFTRLSFYFNNPNNLGSDLIVSDIMHFSDSLRGGVKDFTLINNIGRLYLLSDGRPDAAIAIAFEERNGSYMLKGGLVARKPGLYVFTFSDAPGVYRNNHPRCGLSNFAFINSNVNKHLNLFDDYVGGTISYYDSIHSYCMKVY